MIDIYTKTNLAFSMDGKGIDSSNHKYAILRKRILAQEFQDFKN